MLFCHSFGMLSWNQPGHDWSQSTTGNFRWLFDKVFDTFWDRQRDGKRSFFAQSGNSNNKFLSFNYVFNDIFLQSSVRSKSDQRSVRKNIVQVLIHGHSLIDEAAFFELFYNGVIDSRQSLDNFLSKLIPNFRVRSKKRSLRTRVWPNNVKMDFSFAQK